MKSFKQALNEFIEITQDSNGTTVGKLFLNSGIKKFSFLSDFTFNRDSYTTSTGTNKQYYTVPYNVEKLEYIHVWYNNLWYAPIKIDDNNKWRLLNQTTVYSTTPQYWYVDERTKEVGVYPIFADSDGTLKMGFTKKKIDYTDSEYSTGSVAVSAGSTLFIGTGTSWGSNHIGRYLQIGAEDNSADGFWFEIDSVSMGTILTTKESVPATISGGSYTISEPIPFPNGFEDLPLNYALDRYYQYRQDITQAKEYRTTWTEMQKDLENRDMKTTAGIVKSQKRISKIDPNRNSWAIEITE